MAVCKLQYYQSYFSYYTSKTSDNISVNTYFNPFDVDNYSGGVINSNYSPVSSDDISYDSSTGRVTFSTGGTYAVIFNPSLNLVAAGGSGQGFVDARIAKNGTNVLDASGNNYYHNTSLTPRQHVFSTLVEVVPNDYLEVFVRTITASRTLNSNKGTSLTIFRIVGSYGHIKYTGNDNGSNTSVLIGDNIDPGDVSVSSGGAMAYSSNVFTPPDGARKYLMLSSISAQRQSGGSEITVDVDMLEGGSEIGDSTLSVQSNQDPYILAFSLLNEFDGTQTAISRVTTGGTNTFGLRKATTFSLIDLSTINSITGSFLSLSCDNDSDGLGSGDKNCFDDNNWTSLTVTNHVTASGITYTSSNGKFTVSSAGIYLFICHLVVDHTTTSDISFYAKQEGTEIYSNAYSLNPNWTPRDLAIAIVVDCSASDEFEFGISGAASATVFKAGSSISIFRLFATDPALDLADRGLILTEESTPQAQIADDFDLKTFDIDTLTPQRSRLTDQVPFVLGVPGPLSLRGRCFGQTKEPPIVKPGDEKN